MRSILLCISLMLGGCFQAPSFLTDSGTAELLQGSNEILVATTQIEAEVVQAQVSARSLVTQTIPAAASGALAGASVSFSPGTLALDSTITVQEGVSFVDDEVTSALGLSSGAVNVASAPLVVASSAAKDPVKPFTLSLPVLSMGFWMTGDRLAVMYIVNDYANGVQKTGLIPPADVTIKDGAAIFSGRYFGSYSLVRVSVEIKAPLIVETAKQVVTKSEQAKDTTPPGVFSLTAPSGTVPSPARITWTRAADAVTYGIRIGTDQRCETLKLATRVGNVTTFEATLDNGSYFVCVKAFDAVENAVEASNSGMAFQVMTANGTPGPNAPPVPTLPAPVIQTSQPRSPFEGVAFTIKGSAPASSTVEIFDNGTCTGMPVTSGTDAIFQSSGIPVTVPGPGTHPFSARAISSAGVSFCSNVFLYSVPLMLAESNVGMDSSIDTSMGYDAAMLPNGRLVAAMKVGASMNIEPHVIDLATNTTPLMLDINPGIGMGSSPRNFVTFNGYVYFTADDGTNGMELWRTDGTAGGTTMAVDIHPGPTGSMPSQLRIAGAHLVFHATDPTNGHELMSFDGATLTVHDIAPGSTGSGITTMTVFNNEVYVAAMDGTSGNELWRATPGVPGASLVKDLYPGSGGSSPDTFAELGGYLYFTADDGATGRELWRTDGTMIGTTLAYDFTGDNTSSYPSRMARVGNKLFMIVDVLAVRKLYTFDGATATYVTSLQNPDSMAFASTDQYYFFAQDQGGTGNEPWRSDGTAVGTIGLGDLVPGSAGTSTMEMKTIGRYVVFGIDDMGFRYPYLSDGTPAGTYRITNRRISYMSPFKILGNMLLFSAEDPATGYELYQSFVNP